MSFYVFNPVPATRSFIWFTISPPMLSLEPCSVSPWVSSAWCLHVDLLAKNEQPRCSRVEWKRPCSAKGRKSLQPSQGSQSSCTAFLAYCCGALLFLHAASAPPRTSSVCITGDLTLMNALESCVPHRGRWCALSLGGAGLADFRWCFPAYPSGCLPWLSCSLRAVCNWVRGDL